MDEIQARRAEVNVPGGRRLHDYANVYFDARNPMMYKIRRVKRRTDICVLRISSEILDLDHTVVADQNASTFACRFEPPSVGLDLLDGDLVYARYWNDPDEFEKARKKAIRCAEVLVPHVIPARFIFGAWVSSERYVAELRTQCPTLDVRVNNQLFF